MPRIIVEVLSNTRCRVRKANDKTVGLLDDALSTEVEGARFDPRVRRGLWDGRRHLFSKKRGTFPRGLLIRVLDLLREMKRKFKLRDLRKRNIETPPNLERLTPTILKGITLRPYQMKAARSAVKKHGGILWLATNAGKTEIACAITRVLKSKRMLFLVHKKALLTQTRERVATRFGTIPEHIGIIGAGRFDPRHVTIATIQSLTRKSHKGKAKVISAYLKTVELLFIDEGHHTKATTWYRLIQRIDAADRFILSGTPFGGGNDLLVEAAVGPVLARVTNKKLIKLGVSAKPTIEMVEVNGPELEENLRWDDVYKQGIVNNETRNMIIARRARRFAKEGKPVMVLIRELWQGDNIGACLDEMGIPYYYVHGKMHESMVEEYKQKFSAGKRPVLIASMIFDEGVDVPAIRALVVADGGKSIRAVLQKIGRGLRKKQGGENVLDVVDFADCTHRHLAKHSQNRLAIYLNEGFKVKAKKK